MSERVSVRTLLLLVTLAGCSGGTPAETPAPSVTHGTQPEVRLRNATPAPLVYVAAGEGTLALLDILPALNPGEYEHRLVEPGATVAVNEIIGFERDLGVGFYIYFVEPGSRVARYRGYFLATAAELVRHGGTVTVTRTRL